MRESNHEYRLIRLDGCDGGADCAASVGKGNGSWSNSGQSPVPGGGAVAVSDRCTVKNDPKRDLPPRFGNWNSNFRRFRWWVQKGLLRVFSACYPTMSYVRTLLTDLSCGNRKDRAALLEQNAVMLESGNRICLSDTF